MREPLIHFLLGSGLMSRPQAEDIAACFTPKTLRKQEVLLQAGRVSDEYLFLERGLLRAFVYDTEGNDVTTNFYVSGQLVLEVASFFTRLPSQEHIQALEDGEGWVLSYQQLNTLFHARPEFREFGRSMLVRALVALKARMLGQVTETAATRYDKLVQQSPNILQHVPLKYVASYLGVTDSSLSRIRAGARNGDRS